MNVTPQALSELKKVLEFRRKSLSRNSNFLPSRVVAALPCKCQ